MQAINTMEHLLVCLNLKDSCTHLETLTPPGKAMPATLDGCSVATQQEDDSHINPCSTNHDLTLYYHPPHSMFYPSIYTSKLLINSLYCFCLQCIPQLSHFSRLLFSHIYPRNLNCFFLILRTTSLSPLHL